MTLNSLTVPAERLNYKSVTITAVWLCINIHQFVFSFFIGLIVIIPVCQTVQEIKEFEPSMEKSLKQTPF